MSLIISYQFFVNFVVVAFIICCWQMTLSIAYHYRWYEISSFFFADNNVLKNDGGRFPRTIILNRFDSKDFAFFFLSSSKRMEFKTLKIKSNSELWNKSKNKKLIKRNWDQCDLKPYRQKRKGFQMFLPLVIRSS